MSLKQNKAVALQFYKFLDSGNFEQAQEVVASNFIAHIPGASDPLNFDTFTQLCLMFRSAFPDGKQALEDVIAEEGYQLNTGHFAASGF